MNYSKSYNRKTENKPNLNKVDPDFIEGIAKVLDYGDNKYGEGNWRQYSNINELVSAQMRHIDKFRVGEQFDIESTLQHLDHAASNLMMIRWLLKNKVIKIEDLHFNKIKTNTHVMDYCLSKNLNQDNREINNDQT